MATAIALPEVDTLLDQLATTLHPRLQRRGIADPALIGVRRGGVWVAEALRARMDLTGPVGALDISFHRDDYGRAGLNPEVGPSSLPWDLDGRHVLLVDDVLYTGRTIRAALNEVFDWGRPASVTLAVLIARDGRELPLQADAVGTELALAAGQHVKLRGPDPLRLELIGSP